MDRLKNFLLIMALIPVWALVFIIAWPICVIECIYHLIKGDYQDWAGNDEEL